MNLKIRGLKENDIDDCLKIVLETETSSSRSEAKKIMELSLNPGITILNPNYYVLLLDEKIIGISGLYCDYEDPKDVLWMDYFAVSTKFQRQGLGIKMLENLEIICRKRKVKKLCVFTWKEGALKFYKKNGFKVCGKIENYYGKDPRTWLYKPIL
jgi:GNAT superfamily N-acetyltransferase